MSARRGGGLGPEMVTNGAFTANTAGWTQVLGTIVATAGRLRCTADGVNAGRASFPLTCVVGRTYLLSFEKYKNTDTASAINVAITSSSLTGNIASRNDASDGAFTLKFTATQTQHWIICCGLTATAGVFTEFDNVSVRQIMPG